jgi:hypothetical protein
MTREGTRVPGCVNTPSNTRPLYRPGRRTLLADLPFLRIITHTMPLGDINRAFDPMHEGKSSRSVVTFD